MELGIVNSYGVALPIPSSWRKPPEGKSYIGKEGLLDLRIAKLVRDVLDTRQRLQDIDAESTVHIAIIQGRDCLVTAHRKPGASIRTYSFDIGDGNELRAVYAFRDGHEAAMAAVQSAIKEQRA